MWRCSERLETVSCDLLGINLVAPLKDTRKHSPLILLAATMAGLLTAGCDNATSSPRNKGNSGSFDLAAMKKVIEEKNRQFTKAHVTGDHATIDAMFTRDAKVLPPDSDPVIGRAAIARLTAEYLDSGVAEFREETTDFYGHEDLLIDQGDYVMVYGKNQVMEKGKYVNVWKKEDGTWKIYSNIWNTNTPATPAK